MFAVISISGHQYKVQSGDRVVVDNLNQEVGAVIPVENVLMMFDEDGKVELGAPVLEGKNIILKVLENRQGDKVRVYKMHAKKRYRRNRGFRPLETVVEVEIGGGKTKTKSAATPVKKKATTKKAEVTTEAEA